MKENTTGGTVADLLTHNWWLLALRGLCAVLFGILAFVWPGITLLGLVFMFGAYALVNGILSFVVAARSPKGYPKFGSLIFEGILSVLAGVIAFVVPGITALALLALVAAWAIVTGIMEIVVAVRLRKVLRNEWMLILAGLASLAFGGLLLARPVPGMIALIWWIGGFALVFGVLLIALALRLRKRGPIALAPA